MREVGKEGGRRDEGILLGTVPNLIIAFNFNYSRFSGIQLEWNG